MVRKHLIFGAALAAGIAAVSGANAQSYGAAPVYYGGSYPQGGYPQGSYSQGGCTSACGVAGPVGYGQGQVTNESYPNAVPGQCFTKMLTPEVTEPFAEHVLVSPEKTELRVIPGETRFEEKSVLVKEETVELVTLPATYRTVTEIITVRAGYSRTESVPAVYDTVTEQVKLREGFVTWRPGSAVAGYAPGAANSYRPAPLSRSPDGYGAKGVVENNPAYGGMTTKQLPTGEVLCLVEVPAEYRTITKQVLRTPARTVEVPVPPETRVITRQVVDQPAHVEKHVIPAVYQNVRITLHAPDVTQPIAVPPVYRDVIRSRVVSPSHFEWKQIDCRTDVVHADSYGPPVYAPPQTYGAPTYAPPVPYGERG
jgi:hypothetical protein